ncbi:DUF371 domain-containing protein [Candidatus Woesearchaeota archaeon]|nr:DUF371 domain-containing protein [Candidatus Woesearchaeota archaeon]
MKFLFNCSGHENIIALHRNTIEFTRDKMLSKDGDCILGVKADFDANELVKFLKKVKNIRITLKADDISDEFYCKINKDFNDEHEIVFRITEFNSKRTLGVMATKAAKDINRELVAKMKNPNAKMNIVFEAVE